MEPEKFFVSSCSSLQEGAGLVAGGNATIGDSVDSSQPLAAGPGLSAEMEPSRMIIDHTEEVTIDDTIKNIDEILNSGANINLEIPGQDEILTDTSKSIDKDIKIVHSKRTEKRERRENRERVEKKKNVNRKLSTEKSSSTEEKKEASGSEEKIKFCADFKIPKLSQKPKLNIKPAGFESDPEEVEHDTASRSRRRRKKYNVNRQLTKDDIVTSLDKDDSWTKYASAASTTTTGSSEPATSDSSPSPSIFRRSSTASSDQKEQGRSGWRPLSASYPRSVSVESREKEEYLKEAESDPTVVQKAIDAYTNEMIKREREALHKKESEMWESCCSQIYGGDEVELRMYEGLMWSMRKESDKTCGQIKMRAQKLLSPTEIRRRDAEFSQSEASSSTESLVYVKKERGLREADLRHAIYLYKKALRYPSFERRSLEQIEEDRRSRTQHQRRTEYRRTLRNYEQWKQQMQEKFREEQRQEEAKREKEFKEKVKKEFEDKRREKEEKEKEEKLKRTEKKEREEAERQRRGKEREEAERQRREKRERDEAERRRREREEREEEDRNRREKEKREKEEKCRREKEEREIVIRQRREKEEREKEQQAQLKRQEEAEKERQAMIVDQEREEVEETTAEGMDVDQREKSPCFDELGRRRRGNQFGGLNLILPDPELDPAPGKCYICWGIGHPHKNCPNRWRNRGLRYCFNCGRRNRTLWNCERCKDAHQLFRQNKGLKDERFEPEAPARQVPVVIRKRDRSEASTSRGLPPNKKQDARTTALPTTEQADASTSMDVASTHHSSGTQLVASHQQPQEQLMTSYQQPQEQLVAPHQRPQEQLVATYQQPQEQLVAPYQQPHEQLIPMYQATPEQMTSSHQPVQGWAQPQEHAVPQHQLTQEWVQPQYQTAQEWAQYQGWQQRAHHLYQQSQQVARPQIIPPCAPMQMAHSQDSRMASTYMSTQQQFQPPCVTADAQTLVQLSLEMMKAANAPDTPPEMRMILLARASDIVKPRK